MKSIKLETKDIVLQPLPDLQCHHSASIAQHILDLLVDRTINQSIKQQAFKETLKKYSKQKTAGNLQQLGRLNQFQCAAFKNHITRQSGQPIPLYVDSLLPISADIDLENTYKKRLLNMVREKLQSGANSRKKQIAKQKEIIYHKLNLDEGQPDDGCVTELRKVQQQITSKENAKAVEKLKEMQQKLMLQQTNKEREVKLSFDYNGQTVQIKSQNRKNLVTETISSKQLALKVRREALNDQNPTSIERENKTKKKGADASSTRKRDQVVFSLNPSIAEKVQVGPGTKFTGDGATLQGKVAKVTTKELMKTLSNRRLSKQEFARVKALNKWGSGLIGLQSSLPLSSQIKQISQIKKSQKDLLKKLKGKIVVQRQDLRKLMIAKPIEVQKQKFQTENPEPQQKVYGKIDAFNINYLRSKGQTTKGTESQLSSGFSLPKIRHSFSHGSLQLPKGRQRIKGQCLVRRQLRKSFDQKLRI